MNHELDGVTARWNLLDHTFYQRWTHGRLTRDELCDYVKQYAHVVRMGFPPTTVSARMPGVSTLPYISNWTWSTRPSSGRLALTAPKTPPQ